MVFALVAILSLLLSASAAATPGGPPDNSSGGGGEVVPGSYVVVLDDDHPSAVARQHARQHGVEVRSVYEHALHGYAATMSDQAAEQIARDPRVAFVERERIETIQAANGQTLPTGVDRIETDENPTVSTDGSGTEVAVEIAVLDTGVHDHDDLNLERSVDCTGHSGGPLWTREYTCSIVEPGDGNGHGTHVAGTIGALDNEFGVVGVAPGAPLSSVQVCDSSGRCPTGAIIAGIDWVAEQKQKSNGVDFAAANYSISSADSLKECDDADNSVHVAICGLVETGVVFVMAAGNDNRVKEPFPVAFSVSAIADFDGKAGGAADPTCREDEDDTLADFSNHGEEVDIAAPGVCILSTWNDGGYNTISGTSMAAPHATGAVALYLHANDLPPATDREGADAIKDAIVGAALPQGTDEDDGGHVCSYDDERTGGPLLFVNATAFDGDGDCTVAITEDEDEPDDPTEPVEGEMILTLDGTSRTMGPLWWRATVVATVVTDDDDPIADATVTGGWDPGNGDTSCTTGSDGTCALDSGRLSQDDDGSVTFTVDDVTHDMLDWDKQNSDTEKTVTLNG